VTALVVEAIRSANVMANFGNFQTLCVLLSE
jgi:hypothetical protein